MLDRDLAEYGCNITSIYKLQDTLVESALLAE